jgi:hypothetical protein
MSKASKMQKIFVVLWHGVDGLSQAKIALKISEFLQNHVFNMLSHICCNLTANHRDMHKRPFMGRGRVDLAVVHCANRADRKPHGKGII